MAQQTLIGNEQWSPVNQQGQVYLATHDGEGNALSKTQRSFISFSWGNKDIEDFNLIIISNNGNYQGQMYAPFEDLTTDYEIFDGQHYWGSHFKANELVFNLATDGVLEATLQEFRNWFRPGITRELVLAEYPYRGINARIAEAPTYSLIPFEEPITMVINGNTYSTSTTKWRGSVSVHFVMDDPYWHSNLPFFGNGDITSSEITNQLKAMVEDGVPFINNFKTDAFLPDNLIVEYTDDSEPLAVGQQQNISLAANTPLNLYYCGTAAEKPKISFTFNINQFNNTGYFEGIGNSYVDAPFGSLKIGNKEFLYTTPSILTAYNQAISIILNDFNSGDSIYELKTSFRDSLNNFYIRMWATSICELALREDNTLNICNIETGALSANYKTNFINCLKQIFNIENNKGTCTFDSATGLATFSLKINTFDLNLLNNNDLDSNGLPIDTENAISIVENSGDMVRSKYLTIEDRNKPNQGGYITDNECLKIISNYNLGNFQIEYKYKYL